MLKAFVTIAATAAFALSAMPSALAQGMKSHKRQFVTSYSTSGDASQSRPGRITGIAVDPPDPMRGARLKAGPQAGSAARYHHGVVNRFSQGRRY